MVFRIDPPFETPHGPRSPRRVLSGGAARTTWDNSLRWNTLRREMPFVVRLRNEHGTGGGVVGGLPMEYNRSSGHGQVRSRLMLTISGQAGRLCDGVTRRDALRIGALGLGGLTLPGLLHAEQQAGIGDRTKRSS